MPKAESWGPSGSKTPPEAEFLPPDTQLRLETAYISELVGVAWWAGRGRVPSHNQIQSRNVCLKHSRGARQGVKPRRRRSSYPLTPNYAWIQHTFLNLLGLHCKQKRPISFAKAYQQHTFLIWLVLHGWAGREIGRASCGVRVSCSV
jgi:hypothetical protein